MQEQEKIIKKLLQKANSLLSLHKKKQKTHNTLQTTKNFKIMKNKTAPCNRGGGFMTFRYATGMDWLHDLLEIAIGFGFIPRLNNVTYQLVNLDTGEPLYDEETGIYSIAKELVKEGKLVIKDGYIFISKK